MPLLDSEEERNRYYLLPGMGGRAYRRKHRLMVASACIVGVVISAVLAMALYLIAR
jgi:hypothetical protein